MFTASDTAAVISQSKPARVPSRSIDVSRISPAPHASASRAHSTASRAASEVPLRTNTAKRSSRRLASIATITAWLPYRLASVVMRPGSFSAAVFRLTLSAPASTAASASSSVRMPPPTVSVAVMSRITTSSMPSTL